MILFISQERTTRNFVFSVRNMNSHLKVIGLLVIVYPLTYQHLTLFPLLSKSSGIWIEIKKWGTPAKLRINGLTRDIGR